ncbi:MAG: glycosyltransferase family 4 protein [Flavobacterium sp.]|nr:glycosyltransferase family 4 protein [Flavobacterium sp.]
MNLIQNILVIGFVWPEPNSSAAGTRMEQLLLLFKQWGWRVTYATPAMESDFMIDLGAIGVEKKSIKLNCPSFDNFVQELNPTMVFFDRFLMEEQFGWRVAEFCPNALRILDTIDLHCLRLSRQKAIKEKRKFVFQDLLSEEISKREIASILRCDLSIMVSEVEMDLLQNTFKIDPDLLYYLPLFLDPISEEESSLWLPFEERKDFIFIGNFVHEPNWNAVQNLNETIWPLIRKELPEANLLVYGAYPSQKVLQLQQPKKGFHILGRAENAQEVVSKARVVLAPLRFGAGIKGKLLEAMQCGTPSVTTSIGAESMCGNLPWNGFIKDDPAEFALKAVALYNDKSIWNSAQNNGIAIIEKRYLKSDFVTNFKEIICNLESNLKSHRLKNFMGSVLQHQSLQSSKYMSKWIEEKNK